MTKPFLNFFNPQNNSDRIYSREDINQMSGEEFAKNRAALYHQMAVVGVPSEAQLAKSPDVIYVRAYTREDGTEVRAHYRARRSSTYIEQITNNYSFSPGFEQTDFGSPLLGYIAALPEPDMYIDSDFFSHPINTIHSSMNAFFNRKYPLTRQHMDMFIHGVNNYYFTKGIKLLEPGKLDARLNVLAESRKPSKDYYGVEFTENSEISKILSLSPELKENVIKNIKDNKTVSSFEFKQDRDLVGSYHRVDIFDCKDNGDYYTGYLYDVYDFDSNYCGEYYGGGYYSSLIFTLANQYAVGMQLVGSGKRYYMIIPFRIEK